MTDWIKQAACKGMDVELFFGPSSKEGTKMRRERETRAKAVCARCDHNEDCLQDALERDTQYGIWGGMTTEERNRLVRSNRRTIAVVEVAPPALVEVAARVVEERVNIDGDLVKLEQAETSGTWHGFQWRVLRNGETLYYAEDEADAWLYFQTLMLG